MKPLKIILIMFALSLVACQKEQEAPSAQDDSAYFPPLQSNQWDSVSPDDLGWNTTEIQGLYDYLESENTRAFIILKNGKIVLEQYFGQNVNNTGAFTQDSKWYWASAGKTLTATLVGIAEQEGVLELQDPSSNYLGSGWSSLTQEQEQRITVEHHLTMTTGLDYRILDTNCTAAACLEYKAEPGTQWFYHNATYTLLDRVISQAASTEFNNYSDLKLESPIGMSGLWLSNEDHNLYWSTARDMARFGLLMLHRGTWDGNQILKDADYFTKMTSPSQELNPSYGYLWWLNGEESIIPPGLATSFETPLSENAPADLIAGLGKNGQFVELIPSLDLVVIRMGDASADSLVPMGFHNDMWEEINKVINP